MDEKFSDFLQNNKIITLDNGDKLTLVEATRALRNFDKKKIFLFYDFVFTVGYYYDQLNSYKEYILQNFKNINNEITDEEIEKVLQEGKEFKNQKDLQKKIVEKLRRKINLPCIDTNQIQDEKNDFYYEMFSKFLKEFKIITLDGGNKTTIYSATKTLRSIDKEQDLIFEDYIFTIGYYYEQLSCFEDYIFNIVKQIIEFITEKDINKSLKEGYELRQKECWKKFGTENYDKLMSLKKQKEDLDCCWEEMTNNTIVIDLN